LQHVTMRRADEAFTDDVIEKTGEFAVETIHFQQPQRFSVALLRDR
jgi:hypothetical protein